MTQLMLLQCHFNDVSGSRISPDISTTPLFRLASNTVWHSRGPQFNSHLSMMSNLPIVFSSVSDYQGKHLV